MKRKFGDSIRSKSPVAQRNEALLKVLCHNIVCLIHEIHESGATDVSGSERSAQIVCSLPNNRPFRGLMGKAKRFIGSR